MRHASDVTTDGRGLGTDAHLIQRATAKRSVAEGRIVSVLAAERRQKTGLGDDGFAVAARGMSQHRRRLSVHGPYSDAPTTWRLAMPMLLDATDALRIRAAGGGTHAALIADLDVIADTLAKAAVDAECMAVLDTPTAMLVELTAWAVAMREQTLVRLACVEGDAPSRAVSPPVGYFTTDYIHVARTKEAVS